MSTSRVDPHPLMKLSLRMLLGPQETSIPALDQRQQDGPRSISKKSCRFLVSLVQILAHCVATNDKNIRKFSA